jgi:hypothetical protein
MAQYFPSYELKSFDCPFQNSGKLAWARFQLPTDESLQRNSTDEEFTEPESNKLIYSASHLARSKSFCPVRPRKSGSPLLLFGKAA